MSKKKNKKRRKHLARMRGNRNQNNLQSQQVHQPSQTQQSAATTSSATEPTISLQDSDETPPKSPVASDIRKIAILMTSLAAVVVLVAILNAQTNYINLAGQKVMQVLHIYGS